MPLASHPWYQKYAVRVARSRIDGFGVFAAEPVPARRKIGEIRGESISVREARRRARGRERIMIVEVSDTRAIDATLSADPLRFTNHSCAPNAVLRIRQGRVEFYAMRDIAPGEEISFNYLTSEWDMAAPFTCGCGTPMQRMWSSWSARCTTCVSTSPPVSRWVVRAASRSTRSA